MQTGKQNSTRAREKIKHLERILGYTKDNITHNDEKFLNEKMRDLSEYARENAYLNEWFDLQFGNYDLNVVKKIIANARARHSKEDDFYSIKGNIVNTFGLKEIAKKTIEDGSPFINKRGIGFLGNSIINSPESATFSAKQILYLEGLMNFVEDKVRPHKNGDEFNKNIYPNISARNVSRFLNFAVNGNLKTLTPDNYLELIKNNWYDEETGLDSLRKSLTEYCIEKKRKLNPENYYGVIKDLENFYRRNNETHKM